MSFKNKKILVLTSCSAKKKKNLTKAIDLYDGDFFKQVRKFVKRHNFDLRIVSAKYGLLSPGDKINPYNRRIENQQDIRKLQKKVNPELLKIIDEYDKILVLMGEDYKKIIKPISNDNMIYFFDKRGMGGYKSLMKNLLKIEKRQLYNILFKQELETITIDVIEKLSKKFRAF